MKCPECGSYNTKVSDSRTHSRCRKTMKIYGHDYVRRRRECEDCKFKFTTYETTEPPRCDKYRLAYELLMLRFKRVEKITNLKEV